MKPQVRKYPAPVLWGLGIAGIALLYLASRPLVVTAQQQDLNARITSLEAGQREILKQLQEIKTLLQGRPAQVAGAPGPVALSTSTSPALPQDFMLAIDGAAAQGRADAKLVMVEFSDFECPFCGNYSRQTYPTIEREYVESGKLRYVFRHYPLERSHPRAFKAAEAGECARVQGKFWPLHDRFFANQQLLAPAALVDHASAIGLNVASFQSCLNGQVAAKIRDDVTAGGQLNITGTPTFFIGVPKDGKVHVLQRVVGSKGFTVFQAVFEKILASADGK